jgi:hypothetical protein
MSSTHPAADSRQPAIRLSSFWTIIARPTAGGDVGREPETPGKQRVRGEVLPSDRRILRMPKAIAVSLHNANERRSRAPTPPFIASAALNGRAAALSVAE